jgi:ATP-binding cassette subfamily F protein 3
MNPIKRKKMEDRTRELEAEISRAETLITGCETALQNFVSAEESQRQSEELDRHRAAHAGFIKEWEELSQSLQEAD